jgi:hypothetical protein
VSTTINLSGVAYRVNTNTERMCRRDDGPNVPHACATRGMTSVPAAASVAM